MQAEPTEDRPTQDSAEDRSREEEERVLQDDTQPPGAAVATEEAPQVDDAELAERMAQARDDIVSGIKQVIIGQDEVIELVLLTLFVGGNSLLMGVPGLAKTLLIQTISQVLDLDFSRIQFTPDLMPSDITGTDIIQEDPETGKRELVFAPGPIFANVVLADEINRTPPKTQAALLEAMQEHRVTIQGRTYDLDEPFHVFATQNPIELEGTYPLPEAQLDRFMFEIEIRHLPADEEQDVVRETTGLRQPKFTPTVTGADLMAFQRLVRKVQVSETVLKYAVDLVRATRPEAPDALDWVKQWVAYGASVRAAQYLVLGGKARALTQGRVHVDFQDIRFLADPVLRHRVLTNFQAQSEGVSTSDLVERLLDAVPTPTSGLG